MSLLETVKGLIRRDGWISYQLGLGGSTGASQSMQVTDPRRLSDPEITALYRDQGIAARIVDLEPDHAVGVGLTTGDHDLDERAEELGASAALADAWRWGRAYGLAAIYLGLSDRLGPQDSPISDDAIGVGDLQFVEVFDGVQLHPATYDRHNAPTHYTVGPHGIRVHRSRLILFGGVTTPPSTRRTWGRDDSALQRVFTELQREGLAWEGVTLALRDLSQAVFAVKGLVEQIANGQADLMQSRMSVVQMGRSVARAVVIDADGERYEHAGAQNIGAIDGVMGRIAQRVSTAAGIPATVLLGTAPIGMNATGESDLRIWYAHVTKARRAKAAHVRRLFNAIARSEGREIPSEIEWPALWEPTEKEIAEREAMEATADATRISSGVLDAAEVRLARWGGVSLTEIVSGSTPETDAQEEANDLAIEPEIGETWTDTADGHTLTVTGVTSDRVYFTDAQYVEDDGTPNPARQWSWARASFVERARRVQTQGSDA